MSCKEFSAPPVLRSVPKHYFRASTAPTPTPVDPQGFSTSSPHPLLLPPSKSQAPLPGSGLPAPPSLAQSPPSSVNPASSSCTSSLSTHFPPSLLNPALRSPSLTVPSVPPAKTAPNPTLLMASSRTPDQVLEQRGTHFIIFSVPPLRLRCSVRGGWPWVQFLLLGRGRKDTWHWEPRRPSFDSGF